MLLHRDAPTGRILDGNNPIILVGGHYYLFKQDGLGDYGINFDNQPTPDINFVDKEPCPSATRAGSSQYWSSTNDIGGLFATMKAQRNNLLRIFLTNSFVTSDLFPYNVVNSKLMVEDAVENNHWNETYFNRLLTFAQQANSAGIAIQLSVFNFFDFDDDAWGPPPLKKGFSPWNPANTLDLSPNWGTNHLVKEPDDHKPGSRCINFMNGNADLRRVKQAFINKLVNTLRGQGNIIFELMNEPRGPANTPASSKLPFLSDVADLLLAACGSWRPLLSVNAFPGALLDQIDIGTELDIDVWQAAGYPHFDAIDIVSYHGLSGLAVKDVVCDDTQHPKSFPRVDREGVGLRRTTHFAKFPNKAIIFSTDGAQQYKQTFTGGEMAVRDGQIRTNLDNKTTAPPVTQRHFSDLGNWAYWCLREAVANPGRCHFQNHSSFYRSILLIQKSYASASDDSAGGGNEFTPPYAPGTWTTWQSSSMPPNDFNTAVHFNANTGELVVQLGTVASQADMAQTGANVIGFLHIFTAVTNLVRARASYSPTSVTVRSTGATVIPAVALRIHAINANGSVGGLIARQPVVLQHGAPSGNLELSAAVTAGQRYGLILEANVGVQYQNRWQGYGEVIVRFLGATLIL